MRFQTLSTLLAFGASTTALQYDASVLFANDDFYTSRIPSIYESTLQARRILHLSKIGTVSTVFPSESTSENRPHDVAGASIGQMEYFANCAPEVYNPSLLGVTITTTAKNAAAGSNVTLSLRYHLPADAPPTDDPWAYLPANLPRISMIGSIERFSADEVKKYGVRDCFVDTHPEATIWEPGTDVHESWWGRLIVNEVYFFGGFGDRARITWLPIEMWRNITIDEVEGYRMIGEKGYKPGPPEGDRLLLQADL